MNALTMIRIGDILSRQKKNLRFVTHTGVAVAHNQVLQNTPEKGEHIATLQDFSDGEPVAVHRTGVNPSIVTARAQGILANPKKYHVIHNNCEHTVTKTVRGIAKSPQVLFWCIIGLVVACVILVVMLMPRKRAA